MAGNETKTRIVAHNNIIRITAKSDNAAIDDTVNVDKHPNVEIAVNARLVNSGYDRYDNFLITKDCLIMSRDQNIYLVGRFED